MKAIKDAIDAAIAGLPEEPTRAYIGASSIGHPCDAYLALSYRGFPDSEAPPQLKRIFRDGHRIESMVIDDLRLAGFNVRDRDEHGNQFEFTEGVLVGHVDGFITIYGDELVLEVKSMNKDKFSSFVDYGLAKSHPMYVQQCIALAGLSKRKGSLLVAYNKNNSDYHSEVIPFDEATYLNQLGRASKAALGKDVVADWNSSNCYQCFKRTSCQSPSISTALSERTCRSCSNYMMGLCVKDGERAKKAEEVCSDYRMWRSLVKCPD